MKRLSKRLEKLDSVLISLSQTKEDVESLKQKIGYLNTFVKLVEKVGTDENFKFNLFFSDFKFLLN